MVLVSVGADEDRPARCESAGESMGNAPALGDDLLEYEIQEVRGQRVIDLSWGGACQMLTNVLKNDKLGREHSLRQAISLDLIVE